MDLCLLCGDHRNIEDAHWPIAKQRGRKAEELSTLPVVPLCWHCHRIRVHHAYPDAIQELIEKAPAYWRRVGLWDLYRPRFESWLSRRRTLQEFEVNHG